MPSRTGIFKGHDGLGTINLECETMPQPIRDAGAKLYVNGNWINYFSLVGYNKTHSWDGDIQLMQGHNFKTEDLRVKDVYQLDFEYKNGRRIRAYIRITKVEPGRIYFVGLDPLPEATAE